MPGRLAGLWRHLVSKLILTVGLSLLVGISAWSYFNINYQEDETMKNLAGEADRLSTTIKLGTHYAMMLNSRDDIAETIKNISRQPEIKAIRIYNKSGQITYSHKADEIGLTTNIKAEACYVCHRTTPPLVQLSLAERTRVFPNPDGTRSLGILSAIYNEPGCSSASCHFHSGDKMVLGALDMVLTLAPADRKMMAYKQRTIGLTLMILLLTILAVLVFVLVFVNRPVARMIVGTRRIARGERDVDIRVGHEDEMKQLALAITDMGREIARKQAELNQQRDEYQNLFETVPCIITVQDRQYRLLNYNRKFAAKFAPAPGDYCFRAYKGLADICEPCPVKKTFGDGLSHISEESGFDRDGTAISWLVIASPIKDETGHVVAAMEISLDITERKKLEQELVKSEQKYHAIFNNIPNPVFVLDRKTLKVLDCNDSVPVVYGYDKTEIINANFGLLFESEPQEEGWEERIRQSREISQARHRHKSGRLVFANIRVSPSEYHGLKVLLVTTSDITKRLEAEQQLNQASKLATLGEMATGVAHELNQPLSVIKTVSSFLLKKIDRQEPINLDIMNTMLTKVDANVDRAAKIITHMRLFARKSDLKVAPVQINDVLRKATEMFYQQLRARGILVEWFLEDPLPRVKADPDRLEQVFINLIINARDAIEERWEGKECLEGDKKITIHSRVRDGHVIIEVQDTGRGISPEVRDKIFDPFFTTKEVGKGTGLGLSISYGIVRDCHGDIAIESIPGQGARFIVEFPYIEDSNDGR